MSHLGRQEGQTTGDAAPARLRIAHVNPSFHPATYYGGPTESGYRLARALAEEGVDLRVLTTNANGPTEVLPVETGVERPLDGFRIEYAPRRWTESSSPALLRALPERIRWAQVVHLTATYNFTTFPTLTLARRHGRPVIWTPRGAHLRWAETRHVRAKAAWDALARAVAPPAFVIHATSEREATAIRAVYPAARIEVIPNPVEIPANVAHEENPRFRLLFLGRIDPIKGIDRLLDAVRDLRLPDGRPWVLRVAGRGDPEYVKALAARVPDGLGGRVEWLGHVSGEARDALFRTTDLLVLPSHSENFGMAVAEALAHGVPALASTGTPWHALETESLGAHVDNDPGTLRAALERLAGTNLRAAGARGRAWIERTHGPRTIAQRFIAVAESLRPH